ncbi:MAG TPA: imelysin family protein [Geminicoccaceae bacterium]|nr:imelysin family protein [Geminicoccus sp.]HMU53138.1 imelysin family protein [Geminicoccaceae bacterium]
MERRTRIWIGLGAAILVSGTEGGPSAFAVVRPTEPAGVPDGVSQHGPSTSGTLLAQSEGAGFEGGEGGEGEGGEGGGQVLGTISEFRLSSTDPDAFAYDGSKQVATYAALVHERYAAAHAGAVALQDAVTALLADPGETTLEAARAAWLNARPAYVQTQAFLFYGGPVDAPGGPIKRLASWPIDEAFLDYVEGNPQSGIVNDPSIELTRANIVRLDQAAAPSDVTTGWHAIEFLLWGQDLSTVGPGTRPYADYVAGVGNNDRRREYLRIVTRLLVNDLSTLVAAWAPDMNNYRASILAMDQRNAIGRAFNGMAVLTGYEMGLRRLSAGLFAPGGDHEESRFSDNTSSDFAAGLRGARDVYFGSASGAGHAGFDALVAELDPALDDRVVAAFDTAERSIAALDVPYDGILASPPGSPARAEGRAAVIALTDLAAALRAAGNRLGVLVVVPGI